VRACINDWNIIPLIPLQDSSPRLYCASCLALSQKSELGREKISICGGATLTWVLSFVSLLPLPMLHAMDGTALLRWSRKRLFGGGLWPPERPAAVKQGPRSDPFRANAAICSKNEWIPRDNVGFSAEISRGGHP
jgi:hypothetical protein